MPLGGGPIVKDLNRSEEGNTNPARSGSIATSLQCQQSDDGDDASGAAISVGKKQGHPPGLLIITSLPILDGGYKYPEVRRTLDSLDSNHREKLQLLPI